MHSTTKALKRVLRAEIKPKLTALPSEIIQAESNKVLATLLVHPTYLASRRVSVYISMPGEIVTRSLVRDIFNSGKTLYVPRWHADAMEMVRLDSWVDYLSLPHNRWGIPEPGHDEPREEALESEGLDLIVMPGVAFDAERNRLGHGKGYYDRYLARCAKWADEQGRPQPRTVALALEAQILENGRIPTDETDVRPDIVISSSVVLSA